MPLDAMSFACPDWQDKLARGETPIPDLPLDEIEAGIAVDLFDKLRVPDIPGQPTFGEVGGEWMRDIVRAAFGSVRFEDDPDRPGEQRMVRLVGEIFNLVPKKNGKTTNAAALGLVAMMMNRRPNVDGVIIGPTQEVAEKCFAQACAMIEADDYLSRRFKIVTHRSMIIDNHVDPETGVRMNAKLKIKSFDPKVVTGSIPAFAILDELHVMAESHYADRVIGQIRGGMITNSESLLIIITTQSERPPQGVFKAELNYARDVRDGKLTDGVRMLPILYEFPIAMQSGEDKAWRDPKNWPMVLPNLGRSITIDRLLDLYKQDRDKGPESEARWASQHLNIEIGLGMMADGWTGALHWEAAAMPGLTIDTMIECCDVIVGGIDGGGLDDLAALALLGRHAKTKAWLGLVHAWAFPEVFERRKSIASKLHDLIECGDLTLCDLVGQDAEEMAEILLKVHHAGRFPDKAAIGLDSWGGSLVFVDTLVAAGIDEELLSMVGQGYKQQPAVQTIPRKLKEKTMRHAGQPIMTWCVANAKTELRGSNYVVTKQAAGAAKIDPLMALFNAAMLMLGNPVAKGLSVYRERGALVV
ncbi:terminase large subunit [Defluviimonas aestuarii]|uniref:terminase large subunit domain-containing protein n=1 Tax=Albidovulum aestuarii TaxID=1130726 RepID=UPI00249B0C8D|nr:terminase large subunit [Defluviimonas aestuarii]MDI3335875.1 terminase large subunit [Defluviimonas aestuarii]